MIKALCLELKEKKTDSQTENEKGAASNCAPSIDGDMDLDTKMRSIIKELFSSVYDTPHGAGNRT